MIYTHKDLGKVLYQSVFSNFKDLEFADEEINFYITNMLIKFIDARKVRDLKNFKIENLILEEPENIKPEGIIKNIADSVLFNLGIFNSYYKKRNSVGFYTHIGKRFYYVSSLYYLDFGETLKKISDNFEGCLFGLNKVSKELNLG